MPWCLHFLFAQIVFLSSNKPFHLRPCFTLPSDFADEDWEQSGIMVPWCHPALGASQTWPGERHLKPTLWISSSLWLAYFCWFGCLVPFFWSKVTNFKDEIHPLDIWPAEAHACVASLPTGWKCGTLAEWFNWWCQAPFFVNNPVG